jgi:hypothetical protein
VGYGPTALDYLSGLKTWFRQVQRAVSPGHTLCDPLTRRVPFLHRLDDPGVVEYFDLQYEKQNPKAAFEKAKLLLGHYREEAYVHTLYLNAAARNNDTTEVARRWEEWKPQVENPDDPCLAYANRQTQRWLRSRRLTAASRNAYDLLKGILGSETELPPWPRLLSMALECEGYVPDSLPGFDAMSRLRLTAATDMARVFRIMALLRMVEGKRQESLAFLAAIYHLGQLSSETDNLVEMMVGIICRTIALNGLEVYALNCCDSESDLKELWEVLERFEKRERSVATRDIRLTELSFNDYLPPVPALTEPRMQDKQSAEAEFEILRMATAARYRLLTRGDFPTSNEEFAPLLPQGPPKDPFGDGPLRFRLTTDSLICYSVGPEETAYLGRFKSRRSSGPTARREISIRVPRERQYPFPREGVRATSVSDVVRQFPKGLPIDPWGNRMGTTITATGDVLIYSRGFNQTGFRGPITSTSHALTLQYDPTNGLFGQGVMFIQIPRR